MKKIQLHAIFHVLIINSTILEASVLSFDKYMYFLPAEEGVGEGVTGRVGTKNTNKTTSLVRILAHCS